ncbi:extracellular solute-binding protein [Variovorax ginsengisoli]|uniref:Tungstate transport system substrate-binding protein n=1 Tax=Variovorax ginsengisoli TaxID=363844 RepID=A0ABT9S1A2_9BURK|nr:extracellular solute-binding protein [Variovorax ginsengisoli]MDP9898138.1 tungstate transport system substrate-binding protein [Variovorax ginsengisoli]
MFTFPRLRTVALAVLAVASIGAQAETLTMASTTSTEQSGLFSQLLPAFKQASDIDVKVVAVGTGQAIDMARRGDADVLFVHDTAAEEKFVAEGFAARRYPVMYNDFVLVGPKNDPAGVKGKDIVAALKKIAAGNAAFVSRGDKSGTDAAERRLWAQTGMADAGQPLANDRKGSGYKECGCGMGPALNIAASSGAYVVADRGTWLSFKNRADLAVLVEGDQRLFNQYGVMVPSAAKFPQLNHTGAQKFVDWVVSPAGQSVIASYKIGGEQLFFPNATK